MKLITSVTSRVRFLQFWLYFIFIALAELLTVFLNPLLGVISYSIILVVFIVQSVSSTDSQKRNLILSLSLVPLIRILSLCLPLGRISMVFRFPLIYLPLLAATIVVIWLTRLKPVQVGLTVRYWPLQVAGGIISGIGIGITESLILGASPLINTFSLTEVWLPALILILTTGFVEELIFRGVLQCLAESLMGRQGIIYVSLIFAVLHLGFYSWLDIIFVLLVALFFAVIVKRTGSLLGVTLSHGIANTILFLVAPFILS